MTDIQITIDPRWRDDPDSALVVWALGPGWEPVEDAECILNERFADLEDRFVLEIPTTLPCLRLSGISLRQFQIFQNDIQLVPGGVNVTFVGPAIRERTYANLSPELVTVRERPDPPPPVEYPTTHSQRFGMMLEWSATRE